MREHNVSLQILGDQVPRLSLYDTSWTFRLKTLATSQFSKNTTRPQRLVASNLCVCAQNHSEVHSGHAEVVGLGGLEPPASPLSGVRSNHLSYRPNSRRAGPGPARSCRVDCAGHLCGRLTRFALSLVSKGGDPAAPSDTATLLRLHPSHESLRGNRPPEG